MPLMTRRSSTRGLPRVSVGRSGASRENWSSVSQKQSRFIEGLLSETVNHIFEEKGIFMGPEPSTTLADFDRHGIPKSVFQWIHGWSAFGGPTMVGTTPNWKDE